MKIQIQIFQVVVAQCALLIAFSAIGQEVFHFPACGKNYSLPDRFWESNYDVWPSYLDRHLYALGSQFHTSVRPFQLRETLNEEQDSLNKGSNEAFLGNHGFIKIGHNDSFRLGFTPLVLFDIATNLTSGDQSNRNAAGIKITYNYTTRLFAELRYTRIYSSYIPHVNEFLMTNMVVPGLGYVQKSGEKYHTGDIVQGYFSYQPYSFLNIHAGKDKNFFGDGYRSLLLSDNSADYPFIKLTTSFWKLKYVNLYTCLTDFNELEADRPKYKPKYGVFHYLSVLLLKRINLSLFESVIWQGNDTTTSRGFDLSYLNPMVFYRPVEFSKGSPDNAFLGLNLSVKVNDHFNIYGQVLLDDFLLDSVKSGNGWWANKQAFQIGFRGMDLAVKNLSFQSEFNYARPYTYAHYWPSQNYGHKNQSLAHPLGANFAENISILRYRHKRMVFEFKNVYSVSGRDSAGFNYGGNIFQPNTSYVHETNNRIGQGIKTEVYWSRVKVAYIIDPASGLRGELGFLRRLERGEFSNFKSNIIFIGFTTMLDNFYDDF